MAKPNAPQCDQHERAREWRTADFEYVDGGIRVHVPNVPAWACPDDGEASFTPDTVGELIPTVRELVEIARRARERRSVLTEYTVAVG